MAKQFGIFISYRRADTQSDALHLRDVIRNGMPEARVFIDLDSIDPGEWFEEVIDETIAESQVALVLIGENWESERLNDPKDVHVREIQSALAAGLKTIPVLFNRTEPPKGESLPVAIRALTASNAAFIFNYRWNPDADLLVARLRKIAGLAPTTGTEPPGASSKPAGEEKPSREFDYFDVGNFRQSSILEVEGERELYCVKFSRDQSLIAAGSEDAAFVWQLASGEATDTAPVELLHSRFVYSLAFTSDGNTLVTGCEDGGVRFWDWRNNNKKPAKEYLKAHRGAVYAVAISGNGAHLATGGYDGLVQLWDLRRYTHLTNHSFIGCVSSVAFSPKGNIVAVGTHNDEIYLWDPIKDEEIPLGKHESSVESLAFSPDGSRLASCGLDKCVRLWDVDSRKPLWTGPQGKQHKYLVKSVAFSPDGKVIVSAGWDTKVRLWDVAEQELPQTIPWWGDDSEPKWHTDWIWAASFSPDGDMLASAGSDGKLILWTIRALAG